MAKRRLSESAARGGASQLRTLTFLARERGAREGLQDLQMGPLEGAIEGDRVPILVLSPGEDAKGLVGIREGGEFFGRGGFLLGSYLDANCKA